VIDKVGGCGGESELDGVEVIEDGLVAAVDRAMAFIGDDQIVVAGESR
jgi:hypothetical protein